MYSSTTCRICKYQAESGTHSGKREFLCKRCGNYSIFVGGNTALDNLDDKQRAQLSGWVRDQNDLGDFPFLDGEILTRVISLPEKLVTDRAARLLRWAVEEQRTLDGTFSAFNPEIIARTYSTSPDELRILLVYLKERGYFTVTGEGKWQVTPEGFTKNAEEQSYTPSRQAFIAMWFDPSMSEIRTVGLESGIQAAGYDPIVVDNVEHTQKIDDQIISLIRKSRFVVADFTGHRGGVYFEAGFALGLNLPVIWTCKKDQMKGLHFDIRQYNCIDWETPAELATRLQRRIEAVLGVGPIFS